MPSLRSSERRLRVGRSLRRVISASNWVPPPIPAKGDTQVVLCGCISSFRKCSFASVLLYRKVRRHNGLGGVGRCDDVEPGSAGALRDSTPMGAAPVSPVWFLTAKLHLVPAETLLNIASEMFLVSRLHPRAQNSCRGTSKQPSKVQQRSNDCSYLGSHRVQSCGCPHAA